MKLVPLKVWLISSNITDESVYYSKLFDKLKEKLHIKVDLRLITWNRAFDAIMDAFKNNAYPDVFSLGTTWVHTLSYLGYLAPLPLSFQMNTPLAEWMTQCIYFNGACYAVPFQCETYVLMAKKKNLDLFGIHADDLNEWNGFFSVCKEIAGYYQSKQIDEHMPLVYPIRPEIGTMHRFSVWLFKGGWTFPKLQNEVKSIFRDDITNKTLCYLSDIVKATVRDVKLLQTDTFSMYQRFLNTDQFTFTVSNGARIVQDLLNNRKNDDIIIMPVPSLVPNAKTFGGGSVLTVSSNCKYQESAWRLVEYLTRDEILLDLSFINGNTPSYDSSFWARYGTNPNIKTLKEEHINSTAYFFHPLLYAIEQNSSEHIAHFFWESLVENKPDTQYLADQALKRLDRNITNLWNIMWEMREE